MTQILSCIAAHFTSSIWIGCKQDDTLFRPNSQPWAKKSGAATWESSLSVISHIYNQIKRRSLSLNILGLIRLFSDSGEFWRIHPTRGLHRLGDESDYSSRSPFRRLLPSLFFRVCRSSIAQQLGNTTTYALTNRMKSLCAHTNCEQLSDGCFLVHACFLYVIPVSIDCMSVNCEKYLAFDCV